MEKAHATQAAPPQFERTYTGSELGEPGVSDMDVPHG